MKIIQAVVAKKKQVAALGAFKKIISVNQMLMKEVRDTFEKRIDILTALEEDYDMLDKLDKSLRNLGFNSAKILPKGPTIKLVSWDRFSIPTDELLKSLEKLLRAYTAVDMKIPVSALTLGSADTFSTTEDTILSELDGEMTLNANGNFVSILLKITETPDSK